MPSVRGPIYFVPIAQDSLYETFEQILQEIDEENASLFPPS